MDHKKEDELPPPPHYDLAAAHQNLDDLNYHNPLTPQFTTPTNAAATSNVDSNMANMENGNGHIVPYQLDENQLEQHVVGLPPYAHPHDTDLPTYESIFVRLQREMHPPTYDSLFSRGRRLNSRENSARKILRVVTLVFGVAAFLMIIFGLAIGNIIIGSMKLDASCENPYIAIYLIVSGAVLIAVNILTCCCNKKTRKEQAPLETPNSSTSPTSPISSTPASSAATPITPFSSTSPLPSASATPTSSTSSAPSERPSPRRKRRSTCRSCTNTILLTFVLAWFITGSYWIYSLDPGSSFQNCDKILYLYTFWSVTIMYMILGLFLTICTSWCCLFICATALHPSPS